MKAELTIDLDDVRKAGSVCKAIFNACLEHGQVSSGYSQTVESMVTFGVEWQDGTGIDGYAARALKGGALHYIDHSDGRMVSQEPVEDAWWDLAADTVLMGDSINDMAVAQSGNLVATSSDDGETWSEDVRLVSKVLTEGWRVVVDRGLHERTLKQWYNYNGGDTDTLRDFNGNSFIVGEWSDVSVVALECPSISDAMDYPETVAFMAQAVIDHHGECSNRDAWKDLIVVMKEAAAFIEDIDEDLI